jgi:hypothetical protein
MQKFSRCLLFTVSILILSKVVTAQKNNIVWKTDQYTIYRDSVVQGKFVARAISEKELVSDYQSPVNEFKSPAITFKFSINGKDNEMKSGVDHHFVVMPKNGIAETPLIKFGVQLNDTTTAKNYLPPNTSLRIRLDMREVMNAFKSQGYYTTFNGDKIYKEDFKGVYVAGSTSPLTWDFDNLANHPKLQLQDKDGDGIFELDLKLNEPGEAKGTASQWKASKDVSAFPMYSSGFPISDVLYNMALEEMVNAVEPDSTFRTGKEWAGVWTRDISYSIILSMAYLQPRVAIKSLLRKVSSSKKIIQDTGTGGAWPVSSDRMIWAVAAWEIYKATGDKDWLEQAYLIVKNSIDDDLNTIYDEKTGMVKGESSFLDWREQTYPKWMQPVDIAESECLGTNAVHYQANMVLSKMATELHKGPVAEKYFSIAQKIKMGINQYLWMPGKNYYGQFLYGRNSMILSPRSEALGEALTVLFGIAGTDKEGKIISSAPVTDFGISCIYPQIPNIPPYHNNAVWPFVQTYWLWASAKAGNEKAVMESIAAIYRPAALFVTNKENFVADNGDFAGTQINSSNMLWSLAGNLSIVHKVLFGIRMNEDGLDFQPFVPEVLKGKRTLNNFKYRRAVLDIEMEGYGDQVSQFMIDGKQSAPKIPTSLEGKHQVKIVLKKTAAVHNDINKVANSNSLPAPDVTYADGKLQWQNEPGAKQYKILKNGELLASVPASQFQVNEGMFAEYQVIAVDKKGIESFASQPIPVVDKKYSKIYEIEDFVSKSGMASSGFSGAGFVEISKTKNTELNIPVTIQENGVYLVDFKYANGNGPTNTENKCAIRTLMAEGKKVGTTLFPQRGKEVWSDWGWSNAIPIFLEKGKHTITLVFKSWNENMNIEINQAMVDVMRVIKTNRKKMP